MRVWGIHASKKSVLHRGILQSDAMERMKSVRGLCCLIVSIFLTAPVFAEDTAKEPDELTVKGGKVRFEGISYPVYPGVKKAQVCQTTHCIKYDLGERSPEKTKKLIKKIKAFYKGKKIAGVKLGKFKKYGSSERVSLYASGTKGKKQVGVILIVPEWGPRVYVTSEFDDDLLLLY